MTPNQSPQQPDRNLALELVRVTESAALAASRWVGRGDKNGADEAAVDAMRTVLSTVPMDGIVVIGEGEKDEAPMLFNGERVGDGTAPLTDVAVDPIDGTTLTAYGRANAIAVIAVSERGTMFDPGPCVYMDKIAVGPEAAGSIDITATPTQNLRWIAKAKGESVRDLTVVILDRDRHTSLIAEVRASGARVKLITDGDIFGAIATGWPDAGVDVLLGIGGTPEGVTAAAALKCMGGEIQGLLAPRNEAERQAAIDVGYDLVGRAHHRRPGQRQQLLLRGDRHHRRRTAARRALRAQRGAHPEPGDALEERHGADDRRPPPHRQAVSVRRSRLRLIPGSARRDRGDHHAVALALWPLIREAAPPRRRSGSGCTGTSSRSSSLPGGRADTPRRRHRPPSRSGREHPAARPPQPPYVGRPCRRRCRSADSPGV